RAAPGRRLAARAWALARLAGLDGVLRVVEVPLLQCRDRQPVEPTADFGLDSVGQGRYRGRSRVAVRLVRVLVGTFKRVHQHLLGGGGLGWCLPVGVREVRDGPPHNALSDAVAHGNSSFSHVHASITLDPRIVPSMASRTAM